jgi:mannose-6-phosphate isomerase-like protein (cupin superfamily)
MPAGPRFALMWLSPGLRAKTTSPGQGPPMNALTPPAATDHTNPVIVRRLADLETFKIAAADTNYMAMIADPIRDGVPFTVFLEIFEPGGRTPWHHHGHAHEMFYVLSGQGISVCNGEEIPVKAGESFVVRPGHDHEVVNTGTEKLYCLTFMVPNEGLAELVRGGLPHVLDSQDKAVIASR